MTQTEQVGIEQRMRDACERFYAAFDLLPTQVNVFYGQKPHLPSSLVVDIPGHSAVIPLETHKPSRLEWNQFLLYSPQTGRVRPEELQPGPALFKKMIEARGYSVLMNSNHPALDKFYIFQGDRYIPWAYSKFEYEHMYIGTLKAELESVLKRFEA